MSTNTRSPLRLLRHSLLLAAASCLFTAPLPADERPLRVSDLLSFKDVADPRLSPDGRFVAYTVTTSDLKEDTVRRRRLPVRPRRRRAAAPHVEQEGRVAAALQPRRRVDRVRLEPRGRQGAGVPAEPQGRRGGQAHRLQGRRFHFAWSPDSKRLALVVSDEDPDAPEEGAEEDEEEDGAGRSSMRRLQFMSDGDGYLKDERTHVHVFDVAKKTASSSPPAPSTTRTRPGRRTAVDRVREQSHAAGRGPSLEHRHLRGRGARGRDPARVTASPGGD